MGQGCGGALGALKAAFPHWSRPGTHRASKHFCSAPYTFPAEERDVWKAQTLPLKTAAAPPQPMPPLPSPPLPHPFPACFLCETFAPGQVPPHPCLRMCVPRCARAPDPGHLQTGGLSGAVSHLGELAGARAAAAQAAGASQTSGCPSGVFRVNRSSPMETEGSRTRG